MIQDRIQTLKSAAQAAKLDNGEGRLQGVMQMQAAVRGFEVRQDTCQEHRLGEANARAMMQAASRGWQVRHCITEERPASPQECTDAMAQAALQMMGSPSRAEARLVRTQFVAHVAATEVIEASMSGIKARAEVFRMRKLHAGASRIQSYIRARNAKSKVYSLRSPAKKAPLSPSVQRVQVPALPPMAHVKTFCHAIHVSWQLFRYLAWHLRQYPPW